MSTTVITLNHSESSVLQTAVEQYVDFLDDTFGEDLWFNEESKSFTRNDMKEIIQSLNVGVDRQITAAKLLTYLQPLENQADRLLDLNALQVEILESSIVMHTDITVDILNDLSREYPSINTANGRTDSTLDDFDKFVTTVNTNRKILTILSELQSTLIKINS